MTLAADLKARHLPSDEIILVNGDIVMEPEVEVRITGDLEVSDDVLVSGDLTVSGTVASTGSALTTPTLTTPTLTNPVVTSAIEVVTTNNTIAASETGRTYFLALAGGLTTTLPAVAAGLNFKFYVTTALSGGSHTIVTASAAQILGGHVLSSDLDAGGDADSEAPLAGTTITFVDSKAVAGDYAELICDGTNWYARCSCKAFDAITITG